MKKSTLAILAIFSGLGFSIFSTSSFSPEPLPEDKVALGKRLFHDPILSLDKSISCASCHKPEHGFADDKPVSLGVGGKLGNRNTPSVTNMLARESFFWDGRAATLEEQALKPIENPDEMALPLDQAIARLKKDKYYKSAFTKLYGGQPSKAFLADALAAFEKTLETGQTPFDRYVMQGDSSQFSAAAVRGRELFNGSKAKCFDCHFSPDFTGNEFKNIGLYNGKDLNDLGRFNVTKKEEDKGKFKVPGLRNITETAPYMHNGMFKTLREVVEYYNEPQRFVKGSIGIDTLMQKPLGLTESEIDDIVAFMETLTDDRFRK